MAGMDELLASASCGSLVDSPTASFEADAGVGDDLLPDLGFAGDVGSGLGLRAGQRLHALLAVGLAHFGCAQRPGQIVFLSRVQTRRSLTSRQIREMTLVYETWMIGRRAGLAMFFRRTSRVIGATSPSPKNRNRKI